MNKIGLLSEILKLHVLSVTILDLIVMQDVRYIRSQPEKQTIYGLPLTQKTDMQLIEINS